MMYSIIHPTYNEEHFSIPELIMDLERREIGLDWEVTWNGIGKGKKAVDYPQK